MPPIRVGFVGLSTQGWASIADAPALLEAVSGGNKAYSITAVSTRSAESAQISAKKQSEAQGIEVKAYHGDTSAITNDQDVDLVAVAVNAPDHERAALPILQGSLRKDLFVEWPAGVGLQTTKKLAELAEKKGIRSFVGLQGRQSPVIQKVKELLSSGVIGNVLSSHIISTCPAEIALWGPNVKKKDSYTLAPEKGATFIQVAVGHQLDAFTYLLGEFATVSATTAIKFPTASLIDDAYKPTGETKVNGAADHVVFSGILKSSAIANVVWHCAVPEAKRKQLMWEIHGDKGTIKLESDNAGTAFLHIQDPDLYLNGEEVKVEGKGGFKVNITKAWEEFAKGDKGEHATLEDAFKLKVLLDAIERSAKEGKTINL